MYRSLWRAFTWKRSCIQVGGGGACLGATAATPPLLCTPSTASCRCCNSACAVLPRLGESQQTGLNHPPRTPPRLALAEAGTKEWYFLDVLARCQECQASSAYLRGAVRVVLCCRGPLCSLLGLRLLLQQLGALVQEVVQELVRILQQALRLFRSGLRLSRA